MKKLLLILFILTLILGCKRSELTSKNEDSSSSSNELPTEIEFNNDQTEENVNIDKPKYPREYFACPNWDMYLSDFSNTLLFFDNYNAQDKIKSLKVYEGENAASKKLIYEVFFENGNIIKENFTPVYGDSFSRQYEYDDKNRLIRKYNYFDDAFSAYSDFSYEYKYDEEEDLLICTKRKKNGECFIYSESITPLGYSFTEQHKTDETYLPSYTNTINLSFKDNNLKKYEIIEKNGKQSYEYKYTENIIELVSYNKGRISDKQVLYRENDTAVVTCYRYRGGTEEKSMEVIFSKYDDFGNWTEEYSTDSNSYTYREFEYISILDEKIVSEESSLKNEPNIVFETANN